MRTECQRGNAFQIPKFLIPNYGRPTDAVLWFCRGGGHAASRGNGRRPSRQRGRTGGVHGPPPRRHRLPRRARVSGRTRRRVGRRAGDGQLVRRPRTRRAAAAGPASARGRGVSRRRGARAVRGGRRAAGARRPGGGFVSLADGDGAPAIHAIYRGAVHAAQPRRCERLPRASRCGSRSTRCSCSRTG